MRTSKILLITALIMLLIGFGNFSQNFFGFLPRSTASNSWCLTHPQSQACQFQSAFLTNQVNLTSTLAPPRGALPSPPVAMINQNDSGSKMMQSSSDPSLSTDPYVAALAYKNSGNFVYVGGWQTTMQFYDFVYPSHAGESLGSNTLSGGLNIHVEDDRTGVDLDYLLQFYAYYNSAGYVNVAYSVWVACAGVGFNCSPAFNCPYGICPDSAYMIASGSVSQIGNGEDPIGLKMYWNGGDNAYVFDYQDTYNNPSWWTVLFLQPTGVYSGMAPNGMGLGEYISTTTQLLNTGCGCAYFSQVGFTMSGVATNSNYELLAGDTTYGLVGQCSCATYLDHAVTLPTVITTGGLFYVSYWKEVWMVSPNPAELHGITIGGSGYSQGNDIYIYYSGGTSSGNVQLW